MAIAALYGSWRRSLLSRLFVSSADTQGKPAREQGKRQTRQKQKGKVKDHAGEPTVQPRRGRRPSRKKWVEKKVDSEFDMVIVPPDGISVSGSESDDSDWSIGWFEPHSSQFTDDEEDTFAVLMPCYGSPAPPDAVSRKTFSLNDDHKSPLLDHHGAPSLLTSQNR
ncbi:hypothetical protein KC19_VG064200 [Ceratodon purpureus]|uniref:Uncharacterized protein n=1 Tax=Ceratodon purpureus TaxID=3225 RepID=A0A8T0HN29_CERPU|nr:hypothetical protein KC19_VG064200 [Ceratodon purpureus]